MALLLAAVPARAGEPSGTLPATVNLTNGEWPPYLSQKLPGNGFVSHVVTEAFAAVNIKVTYGFFPWNRAFKYAGEGGGSGQVWHGSVAWLRTPEREIDFLFSHGVMADEQVLFFLKTAPLQWERPEDLSNKIICSALHTAQPSLKGAEARGILFIDRCGKYETLLKRVIKKRCDAAPLVRQVGMYYLKRVLTRTERDLLTWSSRSMGTKTYHLILSKRVPGNAIVMTRFNQGLAIIRANGTYERLRREHGILD